MFYINKKEIEYKKIDEIKEINSINLLEKNNKKTIEIKIDKNKGLWGFGERFDSLNQKGLERENQVYEKFTDQGSQTYLPIPFFLSNEFGVFIESDEVFIINSTLTNEENIITIYVDYEKTNVHIFIGNPTFQLKQFLSLHNEVILPPSWSFGPWMSANRWNSQEEVLKMAKINKELGFNHSVLVIEAWSDEATFYNFNNDKLWPDPKSMIEELNSLGLHLILWQIPVLKKLDENQKNELHDRDCEYAIKNNLVVKAKDGSPYKIPKGRWFENSMIPDFTNPDTRKWWMSKRQYLLDMGVSGFKTDGGEFIYDENCLFFDGKSGKEMKNKYPLSYTQTYYQAFDKDQILFSRAGYVNSWQTPLYWGGDQMSNWSELKHQLIAGLNAAVSGIFYWGFDISGFAGELPSKQLYLRSFLMATFTPVMQWHSEPIGGQFSKIMKSKDLLNDRSPWNIAKVYDDDTILEITKNCCSLREKLLPYIYQEAKYCKENLIPFMKPMFFDYPNDEKACEIDDQYFFGRSLLIAPIIEENQDSREIYLPKGIWYDYQLKQKIEGNKRIFRKYDLSEIGIFINLDSDYSLLENILI